MSPRFSRAKSSLVACLIILGLVALAVIQTGQPSVLAKDRKANSTSKPHILAAYAKLPLSFEANQGQTDSRVQFLSRGNGYTLFLTPTESVLTLRQSEPRPLGSGGLNPSRDRKGAGITGPQNNPQITQISQNQSQSAPSAKSVDEPAVLRMKLLGANPAPQATGLDELPGKSNYFIGNDPKQWRTDVPNYGKVRFAGVYPGVDLVYYGEPAPASRGQRQLEYDFIVAPGADPSAIRLGFAGAERLEIDPQGELALETRAGEVRWHKPVVYQEVGGVRQMVDGHYVRKGKDAVGFQIASYDPRRALIIDPVLVYSTYLGGSGTIEQGVGIAVDSSGNAYVTGYTNSASFPGTSTSLIQPVFGGGIIGPDAFVTKLNPAGNALVYSTYLGGSIGEIGYSIAVDSTGNAYVTGRTDSPNFPMANAFDSTLGGAIDAFVTKLNPAGSALVYSTYLGGSSFDWGLGIAVDSSGNAYVTGLTQSADFPTFNALQPASGGGDRDAFVTKLNAAGSVLVYSTYLGGSSFDQGKGIAVDSSGNAYVAGTTDSTNFPTFNALQPTSGGGFDAFVTKLNAAGSALVYSTYLGGSGTDGDAGIGGGIGIAVDSLALGNNAYVTGFTDSTNFPTANPFQAALGGGFSGDAFVSKIGVAALVSISVTPANPTIPQGGTQQFTATGTFSDSSTQNLTGSVTWASATPSVATITPGPGGGLATGVAPGTSFITATSGSIVGSTTLTVTAAPTLVSISVTPANPTIAQSATQQFTATGTFSDASTQNLTGSVTWSSGTPSVATITPGPGGGLATGISPGTSLITATSGSISGSTTLTVTAVAVGCTPSSIIDKVNDFVKSGAITLADGKPLLAKLEAAARLREAGNCKAASNIYNAFINQLNAQSGKKVDAGAAETLLICAQQVIENCP